MENLSDIRRSTKKYAGLVSYTIDTDGVVSFINHLGDERGSDQEWLERLLMHLTKKPCRSWLDSDEKFARQRLLENARTIEDLQVLRMGENLTDSDYEYEFHIFKTLKKLPANYSGRNTNEETYEFSKVLY